MLAVVVGDDHFRTVLVPRGGVQNLLIGALDLMRLANHSLHLADRGAASALMGVILLARDALDRACELGALGKPREALVILALHLVQVPEILVEGQAALARRRDLRVVLVDGGVARR